MVVLEASAGPQVLGAAVSLLDPSDPSSTNGINVNGSSPPSSMIPVITQTRTTMKLLPKRFINIHSWFSPICSKQLK
ncbi:unnamed protein product, partial [Nesidiocoris tenuis]